jgi:hypothetical protein
MARRGKDTTGVRSRRPPTTPHGHETLWARRAGRPDDLDREVSLPPIVDDGLAHPQSAAVGGFDEVEGGFDLALALLKFLQKCRIDWTGFEAGRSLGLRDGLLGTTLLGSYVGGVCGGLGPETSA